jgi:hypothetical protein
MYSYSEWSETRTSFIAIASRLSFKICHQVVQENQKRMKMKARNHLLGYVDYVNIMDENKHNEEKHRSSLKGQ